MVKIRIGRTQIIELELQPGWYDEDIDINDEDTIREIASVEMKVLSDDVDDYFENEEDIIETRVDLKIIE